MSSIIDIRQLGKKYSAATEFSLKDISFTIKQGSKTGIFGPNGAGKTTLISILCGIIPATKGDFIYGKDGEQLSLKEILYKIGYVPQDFSFYEELTPWQNLRYFGSLYGIDKHSLELKSDNLLNALGLLEYKNRKVKTFSGGMKRRVNLAIGLINDPEILFLDEPTVGVDVQSNNAIMAYLEKLNQKGTTIIYTSHHMNEGQNFCNNIVLLDHGKLIANNRLENLLQQHSCASLEELFLKLTGIEYRDK